MNFNKVKKSINLFKELGLRKFLKNFLYAKREEVLTLVDLGSLKVFSSKVPLEIRCLKSTDRTFLHDLYRNNGMDKIYSQERIDRYFENNYICYLAYKEGKFIGHAWFGNDQMNAKRSDPALRYVKEAFYRTEDILGVDYYILPEERGGGNSLSFMSMVFNALREQGYKRCLGTVHPDNRPARWTYKVLGYKELRTVVIKRIFNYFVAIENRVYFSPHYLSS